MSEDNKIERLMLVSATMREWSDTAGDHHWQAHLAIEELINLLSRKANSQRPIVRDLTNEEPK